MIYALILFGIVTICLFVRLYMLTMEGRCAPYLRFMPS